MSYDVIRPHWVNSLLNGDALSWHKFWSTVPQVTCWRKATSHFHNKWWGVSIQIICNHYSDGRDSVSNHQPHDCLLDLSFRRRSKKTSMLRFTGLCVGNSPGTVNFPHEWPVTRKMFPFIYPISQRPPRKLCAQSKVGVILDCFLVPYDIVIVN